MRCSSFRRTTGLRIAMLTFVGLASHATGLDEMALVATGLDVTGLYVIGGVHAAQPASKKTRPGLGKEIEGAIYQYTATRQSQGKTEKLEGKIRIDGKGIFELPLKRLAPEREKRVGDILTEKEETQLVFNNWDQLSGRAHVKKDKDKTQRNDLWVGYFDDAGKKRWKFELRKIDD